MLVFIFTQLSYVHDPLRFRQTQIQRHFVIGQARRHSAWTWTRGTFHSSSFVNRRPAASDNKGGVWLWMPPAGFVCVCVVFLFSFFFLTVSLPSACPLPHPSSQPRMGMRSAAPLSCSQMWRKTQTKGLQKRCWKMSCIVSDGTRHCEAHSRLCGPEI